ncbi:hypothetical protein [Endozoicomonas sp.]|uniref:hypothetical protein n=1 Tax=Endozoicomonas sp. TaxID=1892382 RepID=UPI003AF944DA
MIQQGFNISSLNVRVKPGEEENLKISARLVYVQSANMGFRIATDAGSRSDMIAGRKLQLGDSTANLRVINTGTGDLVATLVYGWGDIEDSAVTGEIAIKNASSLNPIAPVALSDAQVHTIAANNARQKLTLYADAANTGKIWLAGAKNLGLPLMAGHAHDITEFSGAVQLCGDGAGTQTVYLMEVNE